MCRSQFELWFMVSRWKDSTWIRIKQLWCFKESETNPTDFVMLIVFKTNSSIWLQCNNKHEIIKLVSSHYTSPFKILPALLFPPLVFTCIQLLSLFICLKHKFPTEGITLLLPAVPWVTPHSEKATLPGPNNSSQDKRPQCWSWSHQISCNDGINSFPWKNSFKEISGTPVPPPITACVQSWNRDWTDVERRGWKVISALQNEHKCPESESWSSWISNDSHCHPHSLV